VPKAAHVHVRCLRVRCEVLASMVSAGWLAV